MIPLAAGLMKANSWLSIAVMAFNSHSQYSTVQYSTVQYSTVQYSTVQYSTVQYSTVQYSTVQYSTVQYSTVQYSTVQCSTLQYSTPHHMIGVKIRTKGHIGCNQEFYSRNWNSFNLERFRDKLRASHRKSFIIFPIWTKPTHGLNR